MKVAVIGSRTFNDWDLLAETLKQFQITEIISGGAPGADKFAEEYANKNNIKLTIFHADWKRYPRTAGVIRNTQIIKECEFVIAFWDGKSRGTLDSITKAKKQNKKGIIYDFIRGNTTEF